MRFVGLGMELEESCRTVPFIAEIGTANGRGARGCGESKGLFKAGDRVTRVLYWRTNSVTDHRGGKLGTREMPHVARVLSAERLEDVRVWFWVLVLAARCGAGRVRSRMFVCFVLVE